MRVGVRKRDEKGAIERMRVWREGVRKREGESGAGVGQRRVRVERERVGQEKVG